jgi:hypothetical protein
MEGIKMETLSPTLAAQFQAYVLSIREIVGSYSWSKVVYQGWLQILEWLYAKDR